MKTKKKVYVQPKANEEKFIANEYVAQCEAKITEEYFDEKTSEPCSKFYIDLNNNHTLDSGDEMKEYQSDNTDKYIFTDYYYGWDATKNPKVGDKQPDCRVIRKSTGGGSHYSAFLLKYVVIVNRS